MADRLRFIFSLSRVAATLYQLITAAALSFAEPTNCAGNVFRDILHNTVFYLENVARTIEEAAHSETPVLGSLIKS